VPAFITGRNGWYEQEIHSAFCHENNISSEDSFDRYDLEEAWKIRSYESGLDDWSARSNQLQEDISSYLKTMHWKRLRAAMFLIHRCTCQEEICASSGDTWYFNGWDIDIHVHHLSYANRGNERYRDVILLCKKNHGQWHSNIEKTGESGIDFEF
jgi:hypothetical protein